jgi:hypothetical protein
MSKKGKKNEKANVNPEIGDFDIKINEFGEIVSTHSAEKINEFLDKNLIDRKLKDHPDFKHNTGETQ